MENKFIFLEHTADIKFRAYGKSFGEVFENCALAFSSVISRNGTIKQKKQKSFSVSGKDKESLLYNFLEELIYLLDAEGFIVSKTKVKISKNGLKAEVFGDDVENYKDLDHVKAVTYSEMIFEKKENNLEVQVVLDV